MIPFWKKTDKGGKKTPPKPAIPHTAQQSIPMQRMFEDGTCRVRANYYTRTIAYQDINYQLAQQEDKNAIFEEWCSFLNFFDSSIKFELSFVNMATDSSEFEKSIRIPFQKDGFDDVRAEYSLMLRQQLAKGNNGLTKTKFITFGVEGESMRQVKTRLDHVQNDLLNNFHRLGVQAKPLNGTERLKLMHDMFHMDGESKFRFEWNDLVKSGLSVKDAIAPTAFAFKNSRTFQMGGIYCAASFLSIPECSLTLNDLFELWRKNKVGLKEHTFANYVYMYNRFVRDEIGMMKLKDIRKSDIRSYYNDIVRNGKMALNTLETIQNVLHQVFAVAVDDEYIRVNPTDGVLTAIKAAHQYETPKRHALTLPQQQAFLNFIKKTPKFQHWLPMFTFMLGTGCRISETVGLCWSDIDFESGFITIQHNLVYHDHEVGGCYFTMSTPKTAAGKRAIPILPEVRKALEQERTNQQELELVCEYEIDGISDFVFLNRFGQPQNPQTVNRAIKRISVAYNEAELEKAEKEKREPQLLPPFSCHNLRHTFCTRLCENETNLKIIQDIMGHKDISTTMEIYAEATKEAKAHSFANLNGKLGISV